MTALFAFNPAIGQWVPIDVKDRLCYLLLPAQNLEAHGLLTEFRLGVFDDETVAADLADVPV